ncbi:34021_t:CDS:2, partial [Racocetra persica]
PITKSVENDITEGGNSEDESENSPLREIHTEQTFTFFEVLEQCLKCYSTRMSFKTKIVQVDSMKNQERESAYIDCKFLLNASYRKHPNLVFINKFNEKHTHNLSNSELLQQFSPSFRKILYNKFPKQKIFNRDLYNMISKFKSEAQNKNDALTLYEYLTKLKQEIPIGILRLILKAQFHDVVINNNICKTNKYMMPLSVFVIINLNHRSQIAAIAV